MNVLLLIVVFDTGTVAQHTWLFVEVLKNFAGDRASAHLALCAGVGSARCQVLSRSNVPAFSATDSALHALTTSSHNKNNFN